MVSIRYRREEWECALGSRNVIVCLLFREIVIYEWFRFQLVSGKRFTDETIIGITLKYRQRYRQTMQ